MKRDRVYVYVRYLKFNLVVRQPRIYRNFQSWCSVAMLYSLYTLKRSKCSLCASLVETRNAVGRFLSNWDRIFDKFLIKLHDNTWVQNKLSEHVHDKSDIAKFATLDSVPSPCSMLSIVHILLFNFSNHHLLTVSVRSSLRMIAFCLI